jgi:putative component of toxin-antitoxin plasmid stabilization module
MRHDRGGWDVGFYADEQGREPCREWADGLSPIKKAAFTAGVEVVLAKLGTNVAATEFGKALGGGLYELRIRQTAAQIRQRVAGLPPDDFGDYPPEAILLRVFFCTAGHKIILLMSGYDKAEEPGPRRQNREIGNARKLMRARDEAQKRTRKAARRRGVPAPLSPR